MQPADAAEQIREHVREQYAKQALQVISGDDGGCCGGESCGEVSRDLYSPAEGGLVPEEALKASLGCGNPTALATLEPGEVVLDLGSGGGIDVLLSAQRVGPTGYVYGLDMTDEMLALAEQNRARAGATNVSFLKGHIEAIPLPAESVDVIISNCVINLSAQKERVLREAFRVLRPGGRLAISDIVVQGALAPEVRANREAWVGCIAGALEDEEYRALLAQAGFEAIDVQVTRVYDPDARPDAAGGCCPGDEPVPAAASGRVVSAFVRARKPQKAW